MKTQCPNCKAKFNTNDASVGKQAKCPKCAKPFIIEPFIETPVAIVAPAQSPEPAAPPAKSPEPVVPPVKIAEPIEPPAPIAPPVKSPEPIAPQIKSPMPIAPPVKSPPLAKPRPLAGPEPVVPPVKIAEPVEPPASIAPPVKSPPLAKPLGLKAARPVARPLAGPAPIAPQVKIPAPIAPPAINAEPTKQEQLESKASSKAALSKAVFVYCWTGVRIIAGILGALGLMLAIRKEDYSTLITTFAAANVFLICSVAIELALFYKMWAAIQDGQASISPAKAVGFLFIPVFNIYWALLMVTGFAEDYNAFIQRRAIKTKDLPMTLFLIYAFVFILAGMVVTVPMICVFRFVGLISVAFIGYPAAAWALFSSVFAAGAAHFIAYILFAFKTCNAINALPERNSR
jgi:predicted Zn finger-like uncharacterized protein